MGSSLVTMATFFTGIQMPGHIRHGFYMGLYKASITSPSTPRTRHVSLGTTLNAGIMLFGT